MTLLDAPRFDEVGDRRKRIIIVSAIATFTAAVILFWILAGYPIDWPWNWFAHLRGRNTVNTFLKDVEKNDMTDAYGVWLNDPHWQQHPDKLGPYSYQRFLEDWSPTSSQNEYGAIKSHELAAARMSGNVLVMGVFINGKRSKPVFLEYDPKAHTLGFSPVELYLGP